MARVLIIDDEPVIRDMLQEVLESYGHYCITCSNSDEALEALAEEPFDLILSDLLMPGRSGLDLLKDVLQTHPDAAVILVTARDDGDIARQAIKSGAYDYLVKPFNLKELRACVDRALRRRRGVLAEKS